MTNLTIALESELVRRGRVLAAERGTSLNALIRDFVRETVEGHGASDERKRALGRILRNSRTIQGRSGSARWTREDLYRRG